MRSLKKIRTGSGEHAPSLVPIKSYYSKIKLKVRNKEYVNLSEIKRRI